MKKEFYRSHGHHWDVTFLENPKKKACPHPDEQKIERSF